MGAAWKPWTPRICTRASDGSPCAPTPASRASRAVAASRGACATVRRIEALPHGCAGVGTYLPRWPTLDDLRRPSALTLVVANTLPLLGVLFFDWDLGEVMLVFWAENVVIGLWHAAKLWLVSRGIEKGIVGFFALHYGMFTLGHGVFVVTIFVQSPTFVETGPSSYEVSGEGPWVPTLARVLPVVGALFVSHAYSFATNFVRGGELERWRAKEKGANRLMFSAYGRVIVLHVTILASAWAIGTLGSPVWALAVLVVLKTLVDLGAHVAQRIPRGEAT